ncbi:branched-chain amino acid transport system ATP-binding protein [Roseivivax halotolerans]|uniref:Branched-chain amino acid transport system ATP-binding protein n=1 Tax=Roseivivax halotolerans TaxID=93684 RepID=A0A1I6AJD5_9RHOB|nr:ABC transporter ATP-binding protein [Roseivivax halotolerans]SFQ68802.1 branched-chain amino acid transport system ATP-binding protein [Roseivivax halotolerans]
MTSTTIAHGEPLLQVRNLDKSFGGMKAVDDVTLDLRAGIVTTLVGPNGAGKTTLFNLITGNLARDSGEVEWLGQDIAGGKPHLIARRGIMRTYQDLRLFDSMSVWDNIMSATEYGLLPMPMSSAARHRRKERIEEVLERTGLSDKRDTRALDLAYAERKFLSMARIMATEARLWLLDEPASGLDPNSYERFLKILRDDREAGTTICIIEHNLDIVIGISDRIAFLDRGRLLADAEPDTVLNDPELAKIYFGDQS